MCLRSLGTQAGARRHQSRRVLTIKTYARIQKPFNRFEAKYIDGYQKHLDRFMIALDLQMKKIQMVQELERKKREAEEEEENEG